jgi:hypothetical protein
MKIYSVTIENFRGIRSTKLTLPDHAVLIGDNNTGKSSVFEAIDLALGPDRLSRRPPVDEHDFYQGKYLPVENPDAPEGAEPGPAPKIMVEVTITNLSRHDRREPPTAWCLATDMRRVAATALHRERDERPAHFRRQQRQRLRQGRHQRFPAARPCRSGQPGEDGYQGRRILSARYTDRGLGNRAIAAAADQAGRSRFRRILR